MAIQASATDKEKAIYFLKCLVELVENDRIHVDKIRNLSAAEVIELAEAEAAKAVTGSERLKDGI